LAIDSFMGLAHLTPPPPPIYTAEIVTKWVCVGGAIQERVWVLALEEFHSPLDNTGGGKDSNLECPACPES
jgi:hypothetical protein